MDVFGGVTTRLSPRSPQSLTIWGHLLWEGIFTHSYSISSSPQPREVRNGSLLPGEEILGELGHIGLPGAWGTVPSVLKTYFKVCCVTSLV